ncbi:MAG: hypothetical protein K2W82_05505 [Candidatus Obscuribacterales bacterium]|nr:hypothetical protein [Candidatus Obscuribacterales bacterium]
MIKVCYVDCSLLNNLGHYANACRHISGEFRRRGFQVDVYGSKRINKDLAAELQAVAKIRHFQFSTITFNHKADEALAIASFLNDLRSISERDNYDLYYFNSVFPPQFAAIGTWFSSLKPKLRPRVAIEFGLPSTGNPNYVKGGALFKTCKQQPLLLTFDQAASADYAQLIDLPVSTMPPVHAGLSDLRQRKKDAAGLLTVAFLGHQRHFKGYHLIPEIVENLLQKALPIKILIHNGNSNSQRDAATTEKLRNLAEKNQSVSFDPRVADPHIWQSLLDQSDLIVLPYDPNRYRASYSAVAVEAVGEGIPLIVPQNTTMESLAVNYQEQAAIFRDWTATAVAEAIEYAVKDFDSLAQASFAGAEKWRQNNGATSFVDQIVEKCNLNDIANANKDKSYSFSFSNKISTLLLDGIFVFFDIARPTWLKLKGFRNLANP